jgi:hypothetical protein
VRYKARVDWFIAASLLCGIAVPAYIAVTQNIPWMSAASVVAVMIVFGISYPQWYETTADALIVRSGITTRRIMYGQLVAVRRPSEKTSLNRLQIDYGIGNFLISPQDPQAFMQDIAQRAPQLSRQGQDLISSAASV